MLPLRLLTAAAAFVATLCAAHGTSLEEGRRLTEAFIGGQADTLIDRMTPQMREAVVSAEALHALRDEVEATWGAEKDASEQLFRENAYSIYIRRGVHEKSDVPLVTQFSFDREGKIAGFFVRGATPPAASRFEEYETKASLRLPFDGEWYVYWGGRMVEDNYHAADPGQRYAVDFLVKEKNWSHAGEGKSPSDYYCWGRPVLAPADGTVVTAVSDLPDQMIGAADPQNPAGNHVVIDLGNDEYLFLAHMRRGTISVKAGDRVTSGQPIGVCGNSGNTSEPHLHMHLQTTPELGNGEGLPMQFVNYRAENPVERGEPQRGERVSSQ